MMRMKREEVRWRKLKMLVVHAIDLDGSDPTVDPFLSEYRWTLPYYDSSSQGYMQDGHLTIRIPISNDDGARHTTEEIRVGMTIMSAVRYPDYHIADGAQVTVRIQPFGGYIQFAKSVVSLSESSQSSSHECDLLVQRLSGKGGNSSAVIKLIAIQDAGEGNVCSETTAKDLHIKDDLNLDTPYIHLSWSDQDESDRCVNFDVVNDAIVEGEEVACVYIEQVGGTAKLTETGNTYALITLNDDDVAVDYPLIISVSVIASVIVVTLIAIFIRKRYLIKSYIPMRYAVEVSKCSAEHGTKLLHTTLPKALCSPSQRPTRHMIKLDSTFLPEEQDMEDVDCGELRAAWHYLVSTKSTLCVDIVRDFLDSHKNLVGTLANLTDKTGRKAIHVALPEQREEIEKHLLLCGRYRINPGPVVHRSKTCEVMFAVDVKASSSNGRAVAIKMMKDRHQWECEIRARQEYVLFEREAREYHLHHSIILQHYRTQENKS